MQKDRLQGLFIQQLNSVRTQFLPFHSSDILDDGFNLIFMSAQADRKMALAVLGFLSINNA